MAAINKGAHVCETCGSPIETTSAGDLGCIACLIATGFDAEAEESDTAVASAPDQLGAYTIEHHADGTAWELGHGAMGVTYRAIDKALDRPVALKIINTDHGSRNAEARERFMREARAAAALRHPNVATVYQFGVREETGQFFYAMELVAGETLEERVRRLGPLDVLTTIDIALQVAAALEAAEERGLVHRDLKPGNLMLVGGCENGEEVGRALRARRERTAQSAVPTVKVIDFGVAKAVAEKTNAMSLTHGGFVGTPAFASPEQFTNAPVDVRSDIYSLGATLWFLLTGHMLFSGRTVEEIQEARRSKPLPTEQLKAAHVPRRLILLLMSMLAIEPAARPAAASELARKLQAIRASITGRGKTTAGVTLAAAIIALATIVAVREFRSTKATPSAIPEKSVAVLPFENLSGDPNNAYFAEGIQEEILTRLAKIADLKVISRTSTQRYQSKPGDLTEIAKQLGVANIVEGSVQKAADQVRVNVQLINAQTDSHLWADTYDRKLTDIFGVESEIAKAIAGALQANLTGRDEQGLAVKPTNNPEAYDAYLHGLSIERNRYSNTNYQDAAKAYARAIQLDPTFAIAWARLAVIQSFLYFNSVNREVNTPKAVQEAADRAMALAPEAGESWTAKGAYHYRILRDFEGAVAAYQEAQKRLPNNSFVLQNLALVQRRVGRWQDAEASFTKALAVDPLDVSLLSVIGGEFYCCVRRFDQALALFDRELTIVPDSETAHSGKARVLQCEGRLAEAAQELVHIAEDSTDDFVVNSRVSQALYERDFNGVIRVVERKLNAIPPGQALDSNTKFALLDLGYCQEWTGRHADAQQSFNRAIASIKPTAYTVVAPYAGKLPLALAYAGLGQKQEALEETQQAVKDFETDAISKPLAEIVLAQIQARFGDHDAAIAALPHLLEVPAGITTADLKFNPFWDPLRSDPRFQKLCEEKQQ
jgi:serine/threonine protein kinase/Tfp pilus assembly protein PilF